MGKIIGPQREARPAASATLSVCLTVALEYLQPIARQAQLGGRRLAAALRWARLASPALQQHVNALATVGTLLVNRLRKAGAIHPETLPAVGGRAVRDRRAAPQLANGLTPRSVQRAQASRRLRRLRSCRCSGRLLLRRASRFAETENRVSPRKESRAFSFPPQFGGRGTK